MPKQSGKERDGFSFELHNRTYPRFFFPRMQHGAERLDLERPAPPAIVRSDYESIERWTCLFSVDILLIAIAVYACVDIAAGDCVYVHVCVRTSVGARVCPSGPRCGSLAYHCQSIRTRYPCQISTMTFYPARALRTFYIAIDFTIRWSSQTVLSNSILVTSYFQNIVVYSENIRGTLVLQPSPPPSPPPVPVRQKYFLITFAGYHRHLVAFISTNSDIDWIFAFIEIVIGGGAFALSGGINNFARARTKRSCGNTL